MKKDFNLRGAIVAIVTPFKSDESIDYEAFEKLIEFQIENKTDAILVCGTTGEAVTLNEKEYAEIVNFAARKINKRVPMIVGSGSNSTAKAIHQSKIAIENGADVLLVVSPYYNKPMPDGMYNHFAAVAKNSSKPIILYNVPGRTGKPIPVETAMKLANDFENIVGIKEAAGSIPVIMDLVSKRPEGFKIYSGDDNLAFASIVLGIDGCISVAANIIPKEFSLMINSALQGDINTAKELHYKYLNLMDLNFIESSPMPVKAILSMMGKIDENFRLPMYKIKNQKNRDILKAEIKKLGLI